MRNGGNEKEMNEKNVEKGFLGRLLIAQKERDVEHWHSFSRADKLLAYRYSVLVFLMGVLAGMSGGAFLWI